MNPLFIFSRTTEENKYNNRMVKFVMGGTLLDKKKKEERKGSSLKS